MRDVLGWHVGPDWAGGALDQCLESGPALLKVFQNPDPDPVLRILAKWPDTQIVVRKYFEDSEQVAFLADGRDGGRRCANLVADYYARIQVVLGDRLIWLEGVNEPSPHPYDKAFAQVAEYSQGFAEVAARRGFRPAVVSLSVGQPEGDLDTRRYLWSELMPALYAAQQYGGGYACHLYSAERMDTAAQYYALRVFEDRRMFWPDDLHELPILVTECGIDRGVLQPAPPKSDAGWRFKTSAADYANQLRWFRDKLAPDPTVVGATIFAIGITGDWHSFDVTNVPEITAVVAEQHTTKEVPVPEQEQPIVTFDVTPSLQLRQGEHFTINAHVRMPDGSLPGPGTAFFLGKDFPLADDGFTVLVPPIGLLKSRRGTQQLHDLDGEPRIDGVMPFGTVTKNLAATAVLIWMSVQGGAMSTTSVDVPLMLVPGDASAPPDVPPPDEMIKQGLSPIYDEIWPHFGAVHGLAGQIGDAALQAWAIDGQNHVKFLKGEPVADPLASARI